MQVNVVFILFGGRTTEFAEIMVASAKRRMPDCRAIQLSDEKTKPAKGAELIVRPMRGLLSDWYFDQLENLPVSQFINCEEDTIFKSDVSDVFENTFDIAGSRDAKGIMNAGVTFVKNRSFYSEMRKFYQLTSKDEWNDLQVARQMTAESGLFRVKILPKQYNHIPSHPKDIVGAKIVHYKDIRKPWMLA